MFISIDAIPIDKREHIARIWRIIARCICECDEKSWNEIIDPLHIASSIESISVDTNYVDDTQSVVWCSPAAVFEDAHSMLISKYVKELTILIWTWIAFERTIELLCGKKGNLSERAIEFIRNKVGVCRLHGLDQAEWKVFDLSQKNLDLKDKINSIEIRNIYDNKFLFIHICRIARNYIIHRNSNMPIPDDWGEGTDYRVEEDDRIVFVESLTQLILFSLQTLIYAYFYDKSDMTEEIDSKGVLDDVLIHEALQVLHLNEDDFDIRQMELYSVGGMTEG